MKKLVNIPNLKIERFFGLQALLPLATNNTELISEKYRKLLVNLEKIFLFKQYYAYAVGVILRKS